MRRELWEAGQGAALGTGAKGARGQPSLSCLQSLER